MKKIIVAAVLAIAALAFTQEAFAGYHSCTTSCYGNTCTTNCY